jgi:2-iminobutanoate/2-iminopropanoate deaminase
MKPVQTEKAPQAIGPYSQAVVAGDFVFCSGQIALDSATGELVSGGAKAQAQRVLKNLEEVLRAAGAKLSDVASVTVYLKSMADFKEVNDAYAATFGEHKPARVTVGVSELPKNALVEISCVAHVQK